MLNNASTECRGGRTVESDKKNILLVHCKHYHLEVFSLQIIRPEFFHIPFGLNILIREKFRMVIFTLINDMSTICFVRAAMSVTVFITAGEM